MINYAVIGDWLRRIELQSLNNRLPISLQLFTLRGLRAGSKSSNPSRSLKIMNWLRTLFSHLLPRKRRGWLNVESTQIIADSLSDSSVKGVQLSITALEVYEGRLRIFVRVPQRLRLVPKDSPKVS